MTTTEQIVSQLVMAAQWDYEDGQTQPARAAANMLGLAPTDPRVAAVADRVADAGELTWSEQVGLAAHLLLAPAADQVPLAA